MALPDQKFCVVKTFIELPELDDEQDDQDTHPMVMTHTEPIRCRQSLEVENGPREAASMMDRKTSKVRFGEAGAETIEDVVEDLNEDTVQLPSEEQTSEATRCSDMPVRKIKVMNTFVVDDSEDEEAGVMSRCRSEPAGVLFHRDLTPEVSDEEEAMQDMCPHSTFDPFEQPEEEEEVAMCECKTFHPFEGSNEQLGSTMPPAVGQIVSTAGTCREQQAQQVQHPVLFQLPSMPVMYAVPASYNMAMSPPAQEALPHLLGSQTQKSEAQVKTASVQERDAEPLAPGMLQARRTAGGSECMRWMVDGRKLNSKDQKILSPEFQLEFPGYGPQSFRLLIHAKMKTLHKGGQTFLKSKGFGHVCIKCMGSMPEAIESVGFRITVGKTSRGPFWNKFAEQNCCELQGLDEDWDFLSALGSSKNLQLCVEVVGITSRSN
eukprot:TRINITY_DN1261_c0_g1_i12.p1 TRINITY_DN1261_c0_g1~~TRINITY_DN1261_c0_g1_i12.p1  ORF type:complete len:434 (-),score=114.16 TRINITY_DN1261_c0_g1_i12:334-1635(-)